MLNDSAPAKLLRFPAMWPTRKITITAPVMAITAFLPFEEPRKPLLRLGFAVFAVSAGGFTDAVADPRSIVAVTLVTLGKGF
ncbi:hypothetical protein GCM10009525_64250 [Streptosporangium amethystogenes subsp. fukuiense]